jgi:rod shape-determining protein MreC
MRNLIDLFIRNGGFVTFLILEVLCFALVVNYNTEQNAIFSHTTGQMAGRINAATYSVSQFFGLANRADSLHAENARLSAELYALKNAETRKQDTAFITVQTEDSLAQKIVRPQFTYQAAKAVGNSVVGKNNWVIINRGANDGVEVNTGVAAPDGIVGIVRHVSPNFCMAMSLLHAQTKVSAVLKNSRYFGSLVWEGTDPEYMNLKDIPKHAVVKAGEPVYTSGYSLFFPKGILIGFTGTPTLEAGSNFYTIPVRLRHNMRRTEDVYLINNVYHSELKELQERARNE